MTAALWLLWACSQGPDADGDGLPDAREAALGSDPSKPDSDKDGLKDGEEGRLGTDPTKRDSDGDGASDAEEVARGSDPLVAPPARSGPTPDQWLLSADQPLPPAFRCGEPGAHATCFVHVPGGTFKMGAQATDPSGPGYDPAARPDEGPVHEVTLTPYWILKHEVPADQVELCLGKGWCKPEDFATGGFMNLGSGRRNQPVNGATWEGARRMCAWMGGRLPTEAEWEYAARGAEGRRFPWGDLPQCGAASSDASALGPEFRKKDDVAETSCTFDGTIPSGRLRGASPFGAYGMAGNVWEWVEDGYAADAYARHAARDPVGPATAETRVQRGGGWTSSDPLELRSAARGSLRPDQKLHDVGFRCVRPVKGDAP
jgi:formylglycine-generating enzyme required for sulfatase activity